mmetsp:Transcript_27628/g.66554  ORF Transcript_27628/g.66554 Transcript_27628/m.66554 type:complete len:245 (-) Transcript_27628:423-1157(-)
MSSPQPLGLRKGKTKESFWKGDIEAPDDKGGSESSAVPGRSGHSPAFLLRVTLRKVLPFLLTEEEMHLSHTGKIIVLLRDAIIGIILSLVVLSILIFLDHRDVIHIHSAHNFRSMAFQLMNDPETIATLEESTDLKFLTVDNYESMKREIEKKQVELKTPTFNEKRTKELEERIKSMDADAIRKEYETLIKNPLLEWDKYCGTCAWQGRTSCDERAKYLQETYNLGEDVAKIGAMGAPSCVKQG